jgi:RNA polymerase sigma-70 factor (ECF subfamily)
LNWTQTRSSLITRLRDSRDEQAWRRFDQLYGPVIVRYACRRGLALADAEDVRQIVLLSLVRAMPGFEYRRDKGRFRSYLGRAVGNAIQRLRAKPHRSREWLTDDLALLPAATEPFEPDEAFEREWSDHHLRTAMEHLRRTVSPQSMRIFARLLEGASVETVADELGATSEAVRKVRLRIRERLQRQVREQIAAEERLLDAPLEPGTR